MFFCFDDGSGTKKASTATLSSATTILPMFFASTLFVFVLVGQVNSEEEDNVTVGFFNHTLKNDQVTLRDYSAAVEAGDVYNLTKTGVKIKPGDCLKNCSMQEFPFDGASDNTLPFAYSSAENKDITKFKTRRPSEGRKENCSKFEACGNNEQLCMEWTSLEIAWNKCIWSGDYHIFAHIHPIGEKLVQWNIKDLNGSEKFGLTIEEGGFSMDLKGEKKEEGKYNLTDQKRQHPYCVPKGEGFVKPSKWEIIGKNPVPEHGHLLVFYMLPQSASRKHIDGKVKVDPPDGPDLDDPSATIVFFLIPSLACCCIVSTSCIIHGHYKVAKLDYDFDKREAKKEKKEAEWQKKIDYVNSIDAVVNDYVASITEEDDTNLLLRKAWYKKAKPLGPREYGPAPYSSVGFSTDSYSHIETTTAVEGDRKKDTTKANSLMAATETSKMEAAEHSKMGGKSEEAKAKVEEKSKMGEKSKMATTANSMMETNSKMEEEDKSKSSQQE
uniref:DOMON domain-containing protein n=1 Tax=Meloidogyne floridensis TaxID=298350 RepID=A0A915NKN8_9BILA